MSNVAARPTLLEIDLDAAAHNVRAVRQLVGPERKIFAVIKAGGYGFGAAEMGTAFALSAIAATLFLGGWYQPWFHGQLADVVGPAVLGTKIMLIAFLIFWIRFTYPRFREDQLQAFAWKFLIPLALVNIVATGVLKVAF